jgi:hypothetical protein
VSDRYPMQDAPKHGAPVAIEQTSNGFIVRQIDRGPSGGGLAMCNPVVFNDPADLLAWIGQHFETEADRERRAQQALMEASMAASMQQRIAEMLQPGNPAPFDGSLSGGFPPITTDAGAAR